MLAGGLDDFKIEATGGPLTGQVVGPPRRRTFGRSRMDPSSRVIAADHLLI